jgi:hypothetical protein
MTLEGLLEAFLRPPFEWSLKGGPGWKHYAALVAQTNANPTFGGETMARYFDPAIHRLIELIAGPAGRQRGRSVLGLSQSVGRPDPDPGRDRAAWTGCRAGWPDPAIWRRPATIWSGSPPPASAPSSECRPADQFGPTKTAHISRPGRKVKAPATISPPTNIPVMARRCAATR